ncbi:signal peptidase I [Parafrankia colletiae]|uniref:Signal peptidase I n=1 Tax=Parafrankia colletiae TaxID=573497 RepID=A0A1S1RGV9_9ACTN|nr:signal peptidase I [Parafrankia colletiae]MCK9901074.1 signal peptidase I [Frankia sp. Cpl3]OHV44044.1 signal peptidase I [Parafrankia colletiae]
MSGSDRGLPEPFDGPAGSVPAPAGAGRGDLPGAEGPAVDQTDVLSVSDAADDGPGDSSSAGPHAGEESGGTSAATGRRVSRPAGGRDHGRGSFLRELPILVLVAFLLALLIKTVFVQAFWIPSESMERTLLIDDRVLVNKVVYHFRDVHRGEIVVFNGQGTGFERESVVVSPPSNGFSRLVRNVQELLGLGAPSEKDFIKRVIGVGGDVVACCDGAGRVTVNGKALDEPYVYENDFRDFGPITVPDGDLWLMGDHRSRSSDSRQNGPVPQDKVIGRAFVRVWPLGRFGMLSVPGTFSGVPSATGAPALPGAGAGPPQPAASGPLGSSDALLTPLAALALVVPLRRRTGRRRPDSGRSSAERPSTGRRAIGRRAIGQRERSGTRGRDRWPWRDAGGSP